MVGVGVLAPASFDLVVSKRSGCGACSQHLGPDRRHLALAFGTSFPQFSSGSVKRRLVGV